MNLILERFIAIILYTIPLKAVLPFGYYLTYKYPIFKALYYISLPIALIEKSLPFGELLLFLILFAGLVRNQKVTSFIRFNACQALLLDIGLIICTYVLRIFQITQLGVILFPIMIVIFIFSTIQCIYGIEPELPLISKSSRMQIY